MAKTCRSFSAPPPPASLHQETHWSTHWGPVSRVVSGSSLLCCVPVQGDLQANAKLVPQSLLVNNRNHSSLMRLLARLFTWVELAGVC